jgi:hypothetical protein
MNLSKPDLAWLMQQTHTAATKVVNFFFLTQIDAYRSPLRHLPSMYLLRAAPLHVLTALVFTYAL